jgi:hypothetical protein
MTLSSATRRSERAGVALREARHVRRSIRLAAYHPRRATTFPVAGPPSCLSAAPFRVPFTLDAQGKTVESSRKSLAFYGP